MNLSLSEVDRQRQSLAEDYSLLAIGLLRSIEARANEAETLLVSAIEQGSFELADQASKMLVQAAQEASLFWESSFGAQFLSVMAQKGAVGAGSMVGLPFWIGLDVAILRLDIASEAIRIGIYDSGVRVAERVREVFAQAIRTRDSLPDQRRAEAIKAYARTVAPTVKADLETRLLAWAASETRLAYRKGSGLFMSGRSEIEFWRWTSNRTSRTCPICLALDGELFPKSVELISHVACECWKTPVLVGREEASSFSLSSSWAEAQGRDFLRRVLGPTKANMLASGAIGWRDLVRFEQTVFGPVPRLRTIDDLQSDPGGRATAGGYGILLPGL